MSADNDITLYQSQAISNLAAYSRTAQIQLRRSAERMVVKAELGVRGMEVISNVERMTAMQGAADAEFTNLILRGLGTSENPTHATQDATEFVRQRFVGHLERLGQIADATDVQVMQVVADAYEELGRRTAVDAMEDIQARLGDILSGRPQLPDGKR